MVKRFMLIDLDSTFSDLTFTINPHDYTFVEDEPFQKNIGLDGYKTNIAFPFSNFTLEMSWTRISRTFYLELRNRYRSQNRFVIKDHNNEIAIGCITKISFDEIVSTVPSCYSGSLTFSGLGRLG